MDADGAEPGPAARAADGGPAPGDPAPAGASTTGTPAAGTPAAAPVHRLRDLDRRGRVWALLFAVALLLAPALAFAWAAPDWVPAGDPALMAVRALDVGTSRTPLTGQPSTSGFYGGAVGGHHVAHPGPLHFYLMALPVRLLGPALGMLVVSLAVTAGCVLIAAWATFRQLGALGGAVGAVVLSLITFTTGASSLVNPVSLEHRRLPGAARAGAAVVPHVRGRAEALHIGEPGLVSRVVATMPDLDAGSESLRLRVYLLDHRQLARAVEGGDL